MYNLMSNQSIVDTNKLFHKVPPIKLSSYIWICELNALLSQNHNKDFCSLARGY